MPPPPGLERSLPPSCPPTPRAPTDCCVHRVRTQAWRRDQRHNGWRHNGWRHDGWRHDGWRRDGWRRDGRCDGRRRHDRQRRDPHLHPPAPPSPPRSPSPSPSHPPSPSCSPSHAHPLTPTLTLMLTLSRSRSPHAHARTHRTPTHVVRTLMVRMVSTIPIVCIYLWTHVYTQWPRRTAHRIPKKRARGWGSLPTLKHIDLQAGTVSFLYRHRFVFYRSMSRTSKACAAFNHYFGPVGITPPGFTFVAFSPPSCGIRTFHRLAMGSGAPARAGGTPDIPRGRGDPWKRICRLW